MFQRKKEDPPLFEFYNYPLPIRKRKPRKTIQVDLTFFGIIDNKSKIIEVGEYSNCIKPIVWVLREPKDSAIFKVIDDSGDSLEFEFTYVIKDEKISYTITLLDTTIPVGKQYWNYNIGTDEDKLNLTIQATVESLYYWCHNGFYKFQKEYPHYKAGNPYICEIRSDEIDYSKLFPNTTNLLKQYYPNL